LEALETTYLTNLRRTHAPVLQDYQRQLELLKSQMAARGRLTDAQWVEAELEQIKKIIATTGVMPYDALRPVSAAGALAAANAPPLGPEMDMDPDAPKPDRPRPSRTRSLLLDAGTARVSDSPPSPSAKTVAPGVLEWNVTSLPAGTYDVTLIFAAEKLSKPVDLSLSFAGQQLTATLPTERATGSNATFRLFRVGQVTLVRDANNNLLQLRSNQPPGELQVKSLIFAQPG
jgi:hypothetical protein